MEAFRGIFTRKNLNLVVGILTLFILLWLVMYAVPSLFVTLFDTLMGNAILLLIVGLFAMYDMRLSVGMAIVFLVLYRFSHMRDGFLF